MRTHFRTASLSMAIASVSVLLASGCLTSPASPDLDRDAFTYAAYSSEGDLLLIGTFRITGMTNGQVSGRWEIGWDPHAPGGIHVGPQVGEGAFLGTLEGSDLRLDLNPGWADNNVGLAGTWSGDRIKGRWEHTGIAGPITWGSFELRAGVTPP